MSINHKKKVIVNIVNINVTHIIFLPKITGINICKINKAIAIPNGIYLFILTLENTYLFPKYIIPNTATNKTKKYNNVPKKFPISPSPSYYHYNIYITFNFTYFQEGFKSTFYLLLNNSVLFIIILFKTSFLL